LLKKKLGHLKKKLKEEEKAKAEAQVQTKEKEDLLRNSITSLLGNFIPISSNFLLFSFIYFLLLLSLFAGDADIPADTVSKPPADSAADAISLAVDSGKLVQVLLQKNNTVLSRFHVMVFPKAD
jgi:predicted Zn-dependent peptidase